MGHLEGRRCALQRERGDGAVRDPTLADTVLAAILIAWVLFVMVGGLAVLGWWLGGIFSTQPGTTSVAHVMNDDRTKPGNGARPGVGAYGREGSPGDYIVYDDPDSTSQVLEDDREWHHDRRRSEGHRTCPECGARLGSAN